KENALIDWMQSLTDLAPATVRRLSNDLRAALNLAIEEHREDVSSTLGIVIRNGLKGRHLHSAGHEQAASYRTSQFLSDDQVRRIVRASAEVDGEGDWNGDLARMILVLAATG